MLLMIATMSLIRSLVRSVACFISLILIEIAAVSSSSSSSGLEFSAAYFLRLHTRAI
jgi:hypothetical protein